MSKRMIEKYDKNNNIIYKKFPSNIEYKYKYDKNNNIINFKSSSGREYWYKYDEKNRITHYKNNKGREHWYMYNNYGKKINITKQKFDNIEFRKKEKEYSSRTKCSRFELMEI